METHVKVLGILHLVFGALGILAGIIVLFFLGGLASLIGLTAHDPDAAVAAPLIGGIGGVLFLIVVAISLPGLIAGIGLLEFRPWARTLTIILSAIELLNVPFGTALGIYGLWVLLSNRSATLFRDSRVSASGL